jgi:hypothetical protein
MRQDLDALKQQVEGELTRRGFVVFHGIGRIDESRDAPVFWDTERHGDPSEFLDAAAGLGVKLIVYHDRPFQARQVEEAFEKLEATDLPREEKREMERTLRRLKEYVGFICLLELSFHHENRQYLFELAAPWFAEFVAVDDELDDALEETDDEAGPLGGYYSQN